MPLLSWIAPLYPWSIPYNVECNVRRYQVPFFWVFGMTRFESESRAGLKFIEYCIFLSNNLFRQIYLKHRLDPNKSYHPRFEWIWNSCLWRDTPELEPHHQMQFGVIPFFRGGILLLISEYRLHIVVPTVLYFKIMPMIQYVFVQTWVVLH